MRICLPLLAMLAVQDCGYSGTGEATSRRLPTGLFRAESEALFSQVDSLGFQKVWRVPGHYFIRISPNGKWEQYDRFFDTCTTWRAFADYAFSGDTVSLSDYHDVGYGTDDASL